MNQHDFDILLQKYLAGLCSPDEEKQILEWSDTVFSNGKLTLTRSEQKSFETKIWKRIGRSVLLRPSLMKRIGWPGIGIAATILIVSGLALFSGAFKYDGENKAVNSVAANLGVALAKDYIEIQNTTGSNQALSLEDGTVVTLTKESSLRYPKHFDGKTRRVELEGEAFFNVKRDISRPFFVYTGELVTQVLGTSFNVKSYEGSKTIEVRVLTGRVSVYENQQKSPQNRNGVILRPNQKMTFDKVSKKIVPELVEVPAMVKIPEQKFELAFEEAPLQSVLNAIQKVYGIEIVVETPALDNCTFTGDLNGLPLHTQLRFICKSVNSGYELRGTTFFINGDGCNK
jgi:transmembrane sensor